MSLVKILDAIDGIIFIKTHLKGVFGLSGILELAFLFIENIWHYVQKGSGYILSSTSSQKLAVSPSNNDLLDLCPNIYVIILKQFSFLLVISFSLTSPWFFLEMHASFVHCVANYCIILLCSEVYSAKPFMKKTSMSWIH